MTRPQRYRGPGRLEAETAGKGREVGRGVAKRKEMMCLMGDLTHPFLWRRGAKNTARRRLLVWQKAEQGNKKIIR